MMRFRSNEPPVTFGYGGLGYKPRYNQRFITGGAFGTGQLHSKAVVNQLKDEYDSVGGVHTESDIHKQDRLQHYLEIYDKPTTTKSTISKLLKDATPATEDEHMDLMTKLFSDMNLKEKIKYSDASIAMEMSKRLNPLNFYEDINHSELWEKYILSSFTTLKIGNKRIIPDETLIDSHKIPKLRELGIQDYCPIDILGEKTVIEAKFYKAMTKYYIEKVNGEFFSNDFIKASNKWTTSPSNGLKIQITKFCGFYGYNDDYDYRFRIIFDKYNNLRGLQLNWTVKADRTRGREQLMDLKTEKDYIALVDIKEGDGLIGIYKFDLKKFIDDNKFIKTEIMRPNGTGTGGYTIDISNFLSAWIEIPWNYAEKVGVAVSNVGRKEDKSVVSRNVKIGWVLENCKVKTEYNRLSKLKTPDGKKEFKAYQNELIQYYNEHNPVGGGGEATAE